MLHIAETSGGDVRKAIGTLEISAFSTPCDENGNVNITLETVEACSGKRATRFDRDGDSHYDLLSAFQKSIRGSDPDAAVHYLARLLEGGDLMSVCRRLVVIAAEDIGMAYPQAIAIVKACVDSAFQVGLPEACLPLSDHLKDSHYGGAEKLGHGQGYKYAHDFENHYVEQQYLPDAIKNKKYYIFGDNKMEKASEKYWKDIKEKRGKI